MCNRIASSDPSASGGIVAPNFHLSEMLHPSEPSISADLSNILKKHTSEHTLLTAIKRNKLLDISPSPRSSLSRTSRALETIGLKEGNQEVRADIHLENYSDIPLRTTYDTCELFANNFFEDWQVRCPRTETSFPPVYPIISLYLAHRSTSHGKSKFFPKSTSSRIHHPSDGLQV